MPDGRVARNLDQAREHMGQMRRQSAIKATAGLVDDIVKGLSTPSESNAYLGVMTLKQPRGSLNAIGSQDWIEVELTVDSGACDTVMPEGVSANILVGIGGIETRV